MWRMRKQNKFGARKQEHNGRWYHSKKEAAYAAELDLRKKAGDVIEWKPQVKVSLDVNGYHICNYIVDFEVTLSDGKKELVEVKGFETPEWTLKRKLFEALYPNLSYVVVK